MLASIVWREAPKARAGHREQAGSREFRDRPDPRLREIVMSVADLERVDELDREL